jgi:hypothetical protein
MTARQIERQNLNPMFQDPVDPYRAAQMLNAFKASLQHVAAPGPTTSGWEEIGPSRWERAEWVTPALLTELLGAQLVRDGVVKDLDTTSEQYASRVLRADGDFAAVVNASGLFRSMLNRRRFLDRTAKALADSH